MTLKPEVNKCLFCVILFILNKSGTADLCNNLIKLEHPTAPYMTHTDTHVYKQYVHAIKFQKEKWSLKQLISSNRLKKAMSKIETVFT